VTNRSPENPNRSSSTRFGTAQKKRYIGYVISVPQLGQRSRLAFISIGLLAVTFAAGQWYIYDAVHKQAESFRYYWLTLAYLSGVLCPVVVWLSQRWPIDVHTWKRSVAIHVPASIALTLVGVFVEGAIGWYSRAGRGSFAAAERHYFTQHTQISLMTYWVLIGGIHLYRAHDRSRRRELQASQLEAQLAAAHLNSLRAQLQPHFLFNTLQAAMTLIYADPEGAEEMLLSLSELLRKSLQTLDKEEIPLGSEIAFVEHYAAIQQRRFGDRLRFVFDIHDEARSCAVPSLLLQPLVENAVQHGVGVHKQSDLISIRASVQNHQVLIDIRNLTSSMGDTFDRLVTRGVGLSNTRARLASLYGLNQSFGMRNLSPSGVAVYISFPARPVLKWTLGLERQAV
jgi:two-component system LytT family sensor kinase